MENVIKMDDLEEQKIEEAKATGFDTEMILEFYKRGGKMLSRFKEGNDTGKYIFPNRTEDTEKIVEGMPYRCMVKNPDDCGAAFAKVISQVYIPRLIRMAFFCNERKEGLSIKNFLPEQFILHKG